MMGELYLEDENELAKNDFGSRLEDKDFDQMQAFEKN